MLTVLLVRGCTLEGASLGIEFYLKPDFDRLTDGTASDSLYLFISSSDSIHELRHNPILFSPDRIEAIGKLWLEIAKWHFMGNERTEIYSDCP